MKFKINQNGQDYTSSKLTDTYTCYTKGPNDFQIQQDYIIEIKEFYWKINRVDFVKDNSELKENAMLPTISLFPVFLGIEFIFGSGAIFTLLDLFYRIQKGSFDSYLSYFIVLIICFFSCIYTVHIYNRWNADNKNSKKTNASTSLNHIKPLELNKPVKVPNLILRQNLFNMIFSFVIWYGIIFLVCCLGNKDLVIQNFLDSFFLCLLPIAFVEFVQLLRAIFYCNYDKRLIKKLSFKILSEPDIVKNTNYRILRVNKVYEKYFIIDGNNTLLYKIQRYGYFGRKYIISDPMDYKVGQIDKKHNLTIEYIVRMVNRAPFSVRKKVQMSYNYVVNGLDYVVVGGTSAFSNIICDKNGGEIASITAQKHGKFYELGNTEVVIMAKLASREEILFISLCVTMGNFYWKGKNI